MKTEPEINAEIRYAQGYLDGLRFTLNKIEAETKQVVADTHQGKHRVAREWSLFFAPIGITAGLAIFFFGQTVQPKDSVDMWAGVIMIIFGFALTVIYFNLFGKSMGKM